MLVGIVSRIELQTLVHSTEDPGKVRMALLNLILPSDRESISISSNQLLGYYKNPISLLKVRIKDERLLNRTVEYLSSRLSATDKKTIESKLHLMSSKSGSLYLRFDKQMAYKGILKLGRHDPIRVRIKFSPRWVRSMGIRSLCERIGVLP